MNANRFGKMQIAEWIDYESIDWISSLCNKTAFENKNFSSLQLSRILQVEEGC